MLWGNAMAAEADEEERSVPCSMLSSKRPCIELWVVLARDLVALVTEADLDGSQIFLVEVFSQARILELLVAISSESLLAVY